LHALPPRLATLEKSDEPYRIEIAGAVRALAETVNHRTGGEYAGYRY
jgi:hypothetical protein